MNTITIGLPITRKIDEYEIVPEADNTAVSIRIITLREEGNSDVGIAIQVDGIYFTESGYEKINNSILDAEMIDPGDGGEDIFGNGAKCFVIITGAAEEPGELG